MSNDPVPAGEPAGTGAPTEALAQLLRRSARGDEAAFAEFYDATAARVHGLIRRVIRDPAQSEEVTQEVYWEVWRTASRYDSNAGSPLAWLMTVAHRRAVDRVRASEASHRRESSWSGRNQPVPHDETAERATTALEAARVRSAMTQLTDLQREALQLAYFGGYTHREVAAMLDLPVGTAKTRIRDGLIRLRDALGVAR
ncbi:ECF RNA polymerase sigma factor SigK [Nocardioides limicola]|uniref:ECF RNA polymerase sigma factor SigK n=1 Tax=Nocardioides limicola TaxID=2803368 RepID=UPI0027DB834B|nr:ECF RNA polymerase sigma factor SigK [Nocardioides sp. DJM-14]